MYMKHLFLASLVLMTSFSSAHAFRWETGKDGKLTPLYFRDSDYSALFDRIEYSSAANVPNGMNSATVNTETGVSVIVNWYGDVNDECRKFRADLYYPNRNTPVQPKPELVTDLPISYQRIPVESYSGNLCKGDRLTWASMDRTVNETWVPGEDN